VNSKLDIWVQIGEESCQANVVLLETIQQLRAKMKNLRTYMSDYNWNMREFLEVYPIDRTNEIQTLVLKTERKPQHINMEKRMRSKQKSMGKMKKNVRRTLWTSARKKDRNMYYKENLKILSHHSLKGNLKRQ